MLDSELFQLLKPTSSKNNLKGESKLQAKLVNLLKAYSLTKKLEGVWFHIPNAVGNNKQPLFGKTLAAIGKIKGAPDLCFASKKGVLFLELKTEKGKLNPEQQLFKLWCHHHALPYEVITTIEEALALLRAYEFLCD